MKAPSGLGRRLLSVPKGLNVRCANRPCQSNKVQQRYEDVLRLGRHGRVEVRGPMHPNGDVVPA